MTKSQMAIVECKIPYYTQKKGARKVADWPTSERLRRYAIQLPYRPSRPESLAVSPLRHSAAGREGIEQGILERVFRGKIGQFQSIFLDQPGRCTPPPVATESSELQGVHDRLGACIIICEHKGAAGVLADAAHPRLPLTEFCHGI